VIALVAADKVGNRRPLERVCIPFLYLLPTGKHPVRCHQNRIFREKRTELSNCLGNPEEVTLLEYSWTGCVLRPVPR
jgi:hypothetical protein